MIEKKYIPIIKTGESELRAVKNLDKRLKNFILPLFELTRGRKKPKAEEATIGNNIKFLQDNFKDTPFILDLTNDDKLINSEIEKFLTSENNYENWVNFCLDQKKNFKEFYPTVVIVEESDYKIYIEKLSEQLVKLCSEFKYIVFRAQNETIAKNLILDINNLIKSNKIKNLSKKIIFVLDYRYINNSTKGANITAKICSVIHSIGIENIVISSTSFPKSVSEYMNGVDFVKFKIKEIDFFKNVNYETKKINENISLIYSDYATANPVRNDNVVFARGWIPRIDVPALDYFIYCRRMRREKNQSYADVYKKIAKKVVISEYFKNLLDNNIIGWGMQEIINTSNDNIEGSSPRYWISVRMNIYIELLSKIIDLIYKR